MEVAGLVPIESSSVSEKAGSNRVPPLPSPSLREGGILAVEPQVVEVEAETFTGRNRAGAVGAPEQLGAVRDIVEDAQSRIHRPNEQRVETSPLPVCPECSDAVEFTPQVGGIAERDKTSRSERHLLASDAQREDSATPDRQDDVGKALQEVERILLGRSRIFDCSHYVTMDEFDERSEMRSQVEVAEQEGTGQAIRIMRRRRQAELL